MHELDHLLNRFHLLIVSDETVAKAAKLSEVARVAKLEVRARQLLGKSWDALVPIAVAASSKKAKNGGKAKSVAGAVHRAMKPWAGKVTPGFNTAIGGGYRLARLAAHKKATGQIQTSLQYDAPLVATTKAKEKATITTKPSFTLADEAAIAALNGQNAFWIGEHYGANVSLAVDEAVAGALSTGVGRKAAGEAVAAAVTRVLAEVHAPSGWAGTAAQYFEGVAANAMTVARVYGQLESFHSLEVPRYRIVNPLDERTCPVCGHMDDKEFTTAQGRSQVEAELAADSPDQIKSIHPWLTSTQLLAISPTAGHVSDKDSAALADAGQGLPPFHFRCRCTVDMV